MSDCIDEGCTCSALGRMAPCGWCTSLTQTEVDIMNTYGIETLRWLQTHYMLYEGEWDYSETEYQSLDEFINAAIILAQDDINLRKGTFTRAYMTTTTPSADLCRAALEGVIDLMNRTPPPEVVIYKDGAILPRAALPSATIYHLSAYRRK